MIFDDQTNFAMASVLEHDTSKSVRIGRHHHDSEFATWLRTCVPSMSYSDEN